MNTQQLPKVACEGKINVYSISGDKYLRSYNNVGNLSELSDDEYFSFSVYVIYNGDDVYTLNNVYVRIDGGEPWNWTPYRLQPASRWLFHIPHNKMKKCLSQGIHTAVWYFNGQAIHSEQFMITRNMNWESVFKFPSSEEIYRHNEKDRLRSPYIYGWLSIPNDTRYTEYMIDFKADHLPRGTYCCLGNWQMDLSSLKNRYESVSTEYQGAHAYAGFQSLDNGDMVGIMSFWDIFCKESSGRKTTIRAKRVFPMITSNSEDFGGEGTGAHCIVPYAWKAKHWYRMHLKCNTSRETGNTLVEQWVCDIETGKYTLLCSYDTGVKSSSFMGSIAVFLENFLPKYAGEIRSMEICNARYLNADTKRWQSITNAYIGSDSGLPQYEGSYNFGVTDNRFWMITCGVGGDWFNNGKGKKAAYFSVE